MSDISHMDNLLTAFKKFFEIVPANTSQLQDQFFRLRYQVYSQEFRFPGLETWRFPDGREIDRYDKRSVYSLLYRRGSRDVVGGVRLVLCDPEDLSQPFPIEEHMGYYFDSKLIDPAQLPRNTTAEITRLILAKRFRCRGKEALYPHGMDNSSLESQLDNRRRFPHPVLGLIVALVRMSAQHGITHWYAGMEPRLNRFLQRFSADLKPIGPKVNYCGMRQPCLEVADDMLIRVFQENRAVWELVTDEGKIWPVPQEESLKRAARKDIFWTSRQAIGEYQSGIRAMRIQGVAPPALREGSEDGE